MSINHITTSNSIISNSISNIVSDDVSVSSTSGTKSKQQRFQMLARSNQRAREEAQQHDKVISVQQEFVDNQSHSVSTNNDETITQTENTSHTKRKFVPKFKD